MDICAIPREVRPAKLHFWPRAPAAQVGRLKTRSCVPLELRSASRGLDLLPCCPPHSEERWHRLRATSLGPFRVHGGRSAAASRHAHPEKAAVGTCPDGCPAPRLMMRVSHSEKNRLTKCDSSVLVDACERSVSNAVSKLWRHT